MDNPFFLQNSALCVVQNVEHSNFREVVTSNNAKVLLQRICDSTYT